MTWGARTGMALFTFEFDGTTVTAAPLVLPAGETCL